MGVLWHIVRALTSPLEITARTLFSTALGILPGVAIEIDQTMTITNSANTLQWIHCELRLLMDISACSDRSAVRVNYTPANWTLTPDELWHVMLNYYSQVNERQGGTESQSSSLKLTQVIAVASTSKLSYIAKSVPEWPTKTRLSSWWLAGNSCWYSGKTLFSRYAEWDRLESKDHWQLTPQKERYASHHTI